MHFLDVVVGPIIGSIASIIGLIILIPILLLAIVMLLIVRFRKKKKDEASRDTESTQS